MDESEDNINTDKGRMENNTPEKERPKKRSLVERELETTLTAHVTSPVTSGDGTSTSRYGRARRLKQNSDFCDTEKSISNLLKSAQHEKSSKINSQPTSPVYKMQASNSLIHDNSPKKLIETNLENQIENIYNANISLSRFGSDEKNGVPQSPAKKFSKVYMRKDLIQSKEKDKDDDAKLIKNIFSPVKSAQKSNSHLSNVLERSSEKYDLSCKSQNGYLDTSSVVKTLDFDCSKKKKIDIKETKPMTTVSKSDLFELEARCSYQVGDIVWARMGTFPFWPCIITREPGSDMFVRKKLYGKNERDIIHVTFFGDNGRRSWILDSLLRRYQGLPEFEAARDQFTPESKKKDPRLHAAFFVSDKKLALWHTAIEEADYILREPKRLRIDLLNELLGYVTLKRTPHKTQKSSKITRTDSDVSLSESLYDSLFSEDDGKVDETGHKKNKSLDVSEVVTACLDNMAAKTGLTMIQRQSHMDIWLQKAKSKTPEKSQMNITITVERLDQEAQQLKEKDTRRKSKSLERENNNSKSNRTSKSLERDNTNSKRKKKRVETPIKGPVQKPYSFRKSTESRTLLSYHNEHDYSKNVTADTFQNTENITPPDLTSETIIQCDNSICIIDKVESLCNFETKTKAQDNLPSKEVSEITYRDLLKEGDIAQHDQATPMEVNEFVIEFEETVLEQPKEAEPKSIDDIEMNTPNKEDPKPEEVSNKDTNAFIIETDTLDARPTILKQVEQPNFRKTDDDNCLVENRDETQTTISSPNIDNYMSIDENPTSCGSNQEVCEENQDKPLNIQDNNETVKVDCQKQIEQPKSLPSQENNQEETQANDTTNDINMHVDDDVSGLGYNLEKSVVQCTLISTQPENTTINKETELQNQLLPEIANSKLISQSQCLKNEKQCFNNNVTINDTTVKLIKDAIVPDSRSIKSTNKDKNEEESSSDISGCKTAEIKNHEMVPIIKLTLIKDASVESFKITSPRSESSKRRSLRKTQNKKEEIRRMEEPQFLQYLERRQDAIMDEHPDLNQEEIVTYLYKTWQFETGVSQNETSEIQKFKSPSNFTDTVDSDKILATELLKKTKESEKVADVQKKSETRTQKPNLRLRKSESPSIPKKTEEKQLNEPVPTNTTDLKASTSKEMINKKENEEKLETTNSDPKISTPEKQSRNKFDSENSTQILNEKSCKDVYIVTPKKRSLCLRISKATYEPKVVLERKEINYMKNKSNIEETQDIKMINKQSPTNKKLPVLKMVKTKTALESNSQSVYEIKRSKRSLRKSKSVSEADILIEDNETNNETLVDKTDFISMDSSTQSCIETTSKAEPPVIEDTQCNIDNELQTPSSRRNIKFPEQKKKSAEEEKPTNSNKQINSESKHSKRSSHKLHSEHKLSLEDQEKDTKMLVIDIIDCDSTDVHTQSVPRDSILAVEYVQSVMDVEIEVPPKSYNYQSQELTEYVKETEKEHSRTNSESRRSKRRSCKSNSETIVSVENNKEEHVLVPDVTDCKSMNTNTQTRDSTTVIVDKISANADAHVKDVVVEAPTKRCNDQSQEIRNSKIDREKEPSQSNSGIKRSKRRSHKKNSILESIVSLENNTLTNETDCNSMEIEAQTFDVQMSAFEDSRTKMDVEVEASPKSRKLREQNKSKTEAESSQSNSKIKHSKRISDKFKSFTEPIVLLKNKEENDEGEKETDTQIVFQIVPDNEMTVNDVLCQIDAELEAINNHKAQEPKTSGESNVSQLVSEVKRSNRRSRKLKSCSEPDVFEKDLNIQTVIADDVNCKPMIADINEYKEIESDKPMKKLSRSKSSLLPSDTLEDKQENGIPVTNESVLSATVVEIRENETPVIDLDQEADAELEVPLSKRRSSRLQQSDSRSPERPIEEKQECNDLTVTNDLCPDAKESKEDKSDLSSKDDINNENVISTNRAESSNAVEKNLPNEQEERISVSKYSLDNISLASDFTTGFTDHSSDKDFDPDAVSISSMSSEMSSASVIQERVVKPKSKTDKTNVFQKLMESDNDSLSSMDDITLNELKLRSTKQNMTQNLRLSVDNSIDSIKSDTSERRLRLVLTDCLLKSKDCKLPIIKEVSAKTNEEFEISQSNTVSNGPECSRSTKSLLKPKVNGFHEGICASLEGKESKKSKESVPDPDSISIKSSGSETSVKRRGKNRQDYKPMEEPEFLQYVEMRQDALLDEHPEISPDEMVAYLYKTWQYEESLKSEIKKNDEYESLNLVKGVNQVTQEPPRKKRGQHHKKLINIDKILAKSPKEEQIPKMKILKVENSANEPFGRERELPKRKASKPFYKEDLSDIEDEIEMFEIFKIKKNLVVPKSEPSSVTSALTDVKTEVAYVKSEADNVKSEAANVQGETVVNVSAANDIKDEVKTTVLAPVGLEEEFEEYYDEEELYFEQLTNPKPNIFKGLIREKVCEICEKTLNLVKCKGCSGMFHVECVKKEDEIIEIPAPTRGRKKKRRNRGRKPKSSMDSNEESHSDEKSHDLNGSEENMSIEEGNGVETIVIPDADTFETQLEAKMIEIIDLDKIEYDSYTSDDGISWSGSVAGKCEIVDVKLKSRPQSVNTDDFKCKNCQKDDTPICFVCKSPVSPKNGVERRQKCQVAHCHKFYHLECLEHWPQTQFNAGEPSRNNKKIDEHFEAMACPRHVCHTCVCDDPRGCKTRFSGDKLARCVRCPATYHSFTKCLPAGSQILSASHIVCPRHYEHRPGKIPYHVNTGWCFICALGGNLICCDYCPTSFHADCLNIEPPEGGYMCEDCETGRLPLYGEMVWVKLGHYRWWPGIILHPSEIPDNIMAVKHSPGEFVVRFFGQYDHYWVNRGRVFPFQEGDSGRISTQKSKIDEAFTKAMEHAQRAFEILKNVEPNDEETQDIQSSLLPPHYVKLKVNKPCGALYGRKVDIEESSLTQCECNPDEEEPCGPYSHCLNRMLLTECGPICRAGERCQNRAFEKRQYPKLVPYRTPHRGWGLKTLEPIKAGQFVIEYVGELIDEAEFRRRMQRKHETRDENFYFLTLDKERLIDAGPKGNLARFMNHCCEPNCETQKWTVLGDVRVGLFALHDIPANTEVTFNYNLECTGIEKKQCMCGAKRCAGYIGAKPKQDEPQPKKLKVAAKRTYKKRKNTTESPSTSKQVKPKRPVGRPAKPRELTDIEKDLLIIKNATNGISSDSECSGRLSIDDREKEKKDLKPLKRKRVSFSTEEIVNYNGSSSPSVKRLKMDYDEKSSEIGD